MSQNDPAAPGYRTSNRILFSGPFLLLCGMVAISIMVYFLTSYRTIAWWGSAEYALVSHDLGVAHPPGSLLLAILGWIALKIFPISNEVFVLNLFSGVLAAATCLIVALVTLKLHQEKDSHISGTQAAYTSIVFGAVAGGLALAFSQTLWLYAVKYTPYILTPLFTGLILAAVIGWYNNVESKNAHRWIFLITLLVGLDFSVHRTNILLAPGIVLMVLVCHPSTYAKFKNWIYGFVGLVLGMAFHLLIIPMAAADPYLNAGNPETLAGFWQYFSLKQYGGGFLVNLTPRKAPLWSVQVVDYLRAFSTNFLTWQGKIPSVGLWPGLFGIIGVINLWRRRSRLALGLVLMFVVTVICTVLVFNIPENFFRPMYRHYLPTFVIFSLFVAYGIGSFILALLKLSHRPEKLVYVLGVVFLLLVPGHQLLSNYDIRDFHRNHFAADWADNIFKTLPENSIYICYGDNDTYPMWYFQGAEGKRQDVTIININLLNTQWYVDQLIEENPNLDLGQSNSEIIVRGGPLDTNMVSIPVNIDKTEYGLTDDIELPDSITLNLTPDFESNFMMAQHILLLELIKYNNWKRPICFSAGGYGRFPKWLESYFRPEGLVFRLVPVENIPVNWEIVKDNLLRKYNYRGYADTTIILEPVSKNTAVNYLTTMLQLTQASIDMEDEVEFNEITKFLTDNLPPERLEPLSEGLGQAVELFLENGFPEKEATDSL